MKQSAAKTLGVAALGAAFAAAAAGTAAAAPAAPTPAALGLVTQTVPLGDGLTELPDGTAESLVGGEAAVDQGVKTLPATAGQAVEHAPLDGATDVLGNTQVGNLLGGLPLDGLPIG
ncbi:hypothetical protein ABZX98_03520 [Streptomyces sp. NPDC002992]|uniref:hypothetical protein n=1 Tax=Streptomyces sp. NPDC002992 TaxID=3154273 RepID=UPI0033A06619